jgi:hypothetical protein
MGFRGSRVHLDRSLVARDLAGVAFADAHALLPNPAVPTREARLGNGLLSRAFVRPCGGIQTVQLGWGKKWGRNMLHLVVLPHFRYDRGRLNTALILHFVVSGPSQSGALNQ